MALPKTIYVKEIEERESKDNFLMADENASQIAESEETIIAGEYRLVREVKLVNKTIVRKK